MSLHSFFFLHIWCFLIFFPLNSIKNVDGSELLWKHHLKSKTYIWGYGCKQIIPVSGHTGPQYAILVQKYKKCFLQPQDIRLPGQLVPEKYKVELVPFIIPGNFTIRGKVLIRLKCVSAGNNVTLHTADTELDRDSVVVRELGTERKIPVAEHVFDGDREFYIARLKESLAVGKSYSIEVQKRKPHCNFLNRMNLFCLLSIFKWQLTIEPSTDPINIFSMRFKAS